jgi:hypothetical protein
VADERIEEGKKVIRPRIASWKLKEKERSFFESACQLQNWRLADKARRTLADVTNHLSMAMPETIEGLDGRKDRRLIRQRAVVAAAAIVVRSVGSGMALIACGHLAESAGPTRRGLEARLHGQAIIDDASGEYAMAYARGHGRSLGKLAAKYGHEDDVDVLSRISHADVRGLQRVGLGKTQPGDIEHAIADLRPSRDDGLAAMALLLLVNDAIGMLQVMTEAFDVEIELSPWMAKELDSQRRKYRAQIESLQEDDSARGK